MDASLKDPTRRDAQQRVRNPVRACVQIFDDGRTKSAERNAAFFYRDLSQGCGRAAARPYQRHLSFMTGISAVSARIDLTINGKQYQFDGPMTIAELLASRALDPRIVVVELNLNIIPRDRFDSVMLAGGDQLEIVQMMAGG